MHNNTKSSAVAGVLGVFLGAFGGHDWYLGNTKKAITHVSLCVGGMILLIIGVILMNLSRDIPVFNMLFVCLVIAAYVILVGNGIWGFIEGVIILMQGDAGLAAKGYQVAPQALGGNNMIQPGQQGLVNTTSTVPANTAAAPVASVTNPTVTGVGNTAEPVVEVKNTAEPQKPTEVVAQNVPKAPDFKTVEPVKPVELVTAPVDVAKPAETGAAPTVAKPTEDSGAAAAKPAGN